MTEYVIREESGKLFHISYYYCGDFYFKPDGSKVYLLVSHNFVKKRAVSSPWEVNTISDTDEESNTLSEFSDALSIHISTNGTKMYIAGRDTSDTYIVAQYSLSTPWSISTISLDKTDTLGIKPRYICFKPDGTKMYVLDGDTNSICQFSLSTAWDIGTATSEGSFSITEDAYVNAFFISDNGKYMIVAGNQNKKLYFYKLDTPWDISTATYTGYSVSRPYSILGVYISPFMLKVYDELYLPDYTAQLRQFMVSKVEWIKAEWIPKLSGWSFVRPIKITEQSGNNLSDYQVLIELNSSNFDFSKAKSDGSDIRFLLPSGKSIPYWIESWDKSGQNAKVWVKVPSIPANSSTVIYMYYGNPSASSESNVDAVFIRDIGNLQAAWHMDEGSGNTVYDTSGNNYHGTLVNSPDWVDGKFGKALKFRDADHTYVNFGNSVQMDGKSYSVIIWVYPQSNSKSNCIFSKGHTGTDHGFHITLFQASSTSVGLRHWADDFAVSNAIPSLNQWYFLAFTFNCGTKEGKIYVNGELKGTHTFSGCLSDTNGYSLHMGEYYIESYDRDFEGILDEAFIFLDKVLTQEEIQDIYNNRPYTTTNYPHHLLVRKYTSPEPTFTVGPEIWL